MAQTNGMHAAPKAASLFAAEESVRVGVTVTYAPAADDVQPNRTVKSDTKEGNAAVPRLSAQADAGVTNAKVVTAAAVGTTEVVATTRRVSALASVDVPDLSKDADVAELPMELRRLRDFNGKGSAEAPSLVVGGPRKRTQLRPFAPASEPRRARTEPRKSQASPHSPHAHGAVGTVETSSSASLSSNTALGGDAAGESAAASTQPKSKPKPKRAKVGDGPQSTSKRGKARVGDVPRTSLAVEEGYAGDIGHPNPPSDAHSSSKAIPLEVKRLKDFNSKGLSEESGRAATRAPAAALTNPPSDSASAGPAVADSPPSPPVPEPVPFTTPLVGDAEEAPAHKVWIMMSGASHRRFVKEMGARYRYKQHVPTPEFLRSHGCVILHPFLSLSHFFYVCVCVCMCVCVCVCVCVYVCVLIERDRTVL